MKLEQMSMKDLLALHDEIADKPAGPKTFSTRGKLVARIERIAADKNTDVASFSQATAAAQGCRAEHTAADRYRREPRSRQNHRPNPRPRG